MQVRWEGVYPALTTELTPQGRVDAAAVEGHARWLVEQGCAGLVPLGSLGEGAALDFDERLEVLRAVLAGAGGRVPVVAGIAALSTAEAVRLACAAQAQGCSALMVLPPLTHTPDWRELRAHLGAVLQSTGLPAMLYNNPAAYRTDFLPAQIAELAAAYPGLAAVKESSGDARRITALRALCADRLALLVGLDDCVVEGVRAGARGWVAGLVNAFPRESVALFALACDGRPEQAAALDALHRWFLPLLRLDGLPKFVQHLKLAQELVGRGSARVRPPRLPLEGEELAAARQAIAAALATRPAV